MVAALLELYHSPTAITPLPAGLLCCFQELICLLVFRTVFGTVPFAVTETTHLHLAAATLTIPLTVLFMYIFRFNPFAASTRWTIYPIFGRKLLKFPIPRPLEIVVKEFLYMFEGYMINCTTFRGHMLRIGD
jgi:hypothetical protein